MGVLNDMNKDMFGNVLHLSGAQYTERIASYLHYRFEALGMEVYREIPIGKSLFGKNRRVDILCTAPHARPFAIECKYQSSPGTAEEKLVYAIQDMIVAPIDGVICYAGDGFSAGALEYLKLSPHCVQCMPQSLRRSTKSTSEMDVAIGIHFNWKHLITSNAKPWLP